MKTKVSIALVLLATLALIALIWQKGDKEETDITVENTEQQAQEEIKLTNEKSLKEQRLAAIDATAVYDDGTGFKPIPRFMNKSLSWLAKAQLPNGGWGAGNHNNQQNRNPKRVKADPATTAFTAMALMRGGHTLDHGAFSTHLNKALVYMVEKVENADDTNSNITNMKGTQPQRKLGENIDVAMTLQFLNRIYPLMDDDHEMIDRVDKAIDICIDKLEKTQLADGSWNGAGWAPVLNSAMVNNALEVSKQQGHEVSDQVIAKSKGYQAKNYDENGIKTEKAAGIPLYAYSSTQRATAKDAAEVNKALKDANVKVNKRSKEAEAMAFSVLNEKYDEDKARSLARSYSAYNASTESLKSDDILSGFGNNGGEEYLSYAMTSESLVAAGNEEEYNTWISKMSDLFAQTQNPNGSWTGHHCITSPVFCTAAVVMAMTADRDVAYLQEALNDSKY